MGHDVVTLALEGAGACRRARPPSATWQGSSGSSPSPMRIALYVDDGAGSIVEIVRRLEAAEIRVGAITVSRPSLDDVFLQATGRRLEGAREEGGV